MTQVLPHLFISDLQTASDESFLKSKEIVNILSLETERPQFSPAITHKYIDITDEENSVLLLNLCEITSWIRDNIRRGGNTLVHCRHGISRSGAAVVAFVMVDQQLDYESALKIVRISRSQVEPNSGFEKQLRLWHRMNFRLDFNNLQLQLFLMWHGIDRSGLYTTDHWNYAKAATTTNYKCSKCRTPLFFDSHVIGHSMADDSDAWLQKLEAQSEEKSCRFGTFIVSTLPWFPPPSSSGGVDKLTCPKCRQKLGSNVTSAPSRLTCPCGASSSVGAWVNAKAVDKMPVNLTRGLQSLTQPMASMAISS